MPDLRQAVEKTIKDYVADKKDEKFGYHDWLHLLANILAASKEAVEGTVGDDAEFNACVGDVEFCVTTYFVPLDLPFVGPAIETFVDRQCVAAVRPAMEMIRPSERHPT